MPVKIHSALWWMPLVASAACQAQGSGDHDEYVKIDDMEADNSESAWGDKYRARWYASSSSACQTDWIEPRPCFDCSTASNQGMFQPRTPGQTMPGVTSAKAARLRTTQELETAPKAGEQERCWGANITVDLVQAPRSDGGPDDALAADADTGSVGQPVDLSAYRGVVFWAQASTSLEHKIQVLVRDANSDPGGGRCGLGDGGAGASPSEKCYNDFSTFLDLSASFTRYQVSFSEMWRDPTWGHTPDPYEPDLGHVYQIAFQVNAPKCAADPNAKCVSDHIPLAFDFWIDDLYLVKRP